MRQLASHLERRQIAHPPARKVRRAANAVTLDEASRPLPVGRSLGRLGPFYVEVGFVLLIEVDV